MYVARDQNEILQELQRQSGIEASKIEGTFENDVLASNSFEFSKSEVEIEQLYKAAFADTSWGEYLTLRAAEFGIDRKPAVRAIGALTITGTKGIIVPQGSVFSTDNNVYFTTDAACTIADNGTVDVKITAQIAGTSGNVGANTIDKIPMSIPGVSKVINKDATHDGFEEETDESLLKRYLVHVRTPATSGNVMHYKEWALSVAGVGDVKVIPLWNGNGTVKVLVTDVNKNAASQELQKKVADYIETVRPIGATVTVTAPAYLNINVTANVKVNQEYLQDYASVLKNTLDAYLVDSGFDSDYVSIAQVGKVLLNSGVISDYDSLKINGGISNVRIPSGYLPRAGTMGVTRVD